MATKRSPSPATSSQGGPSDPKRQRPLTASCSACRERKVRCDGERPCASCVKNARDCNYRPKMKPGLKSGSGQVEKRLSEVERLLATHNDQIAMLLRHSNLTGFDLTEHRHQHHHQQQQQQQQQQPEPTPRIGSHDRDRSRHSISSEPSSAHEMAFSIRNFPQMSPQEHPPRTPYDMAPFDSGPPMQQRPQQQQPQIPPPLPPMEMGFHDNPLLQLANHIPQDPPSSAGPSQRRTSMSSMSNPSHRDEIWGTRSVPPPSMGIPSSKPHLLHSISEGLDLPPSDVLAELIDLFWTHIHPWCPILLRTDLTLPATPHAAHTPESTGSARSAHSQHSLVVWAIVAITLRLSTNPHFSTGITSKNHYYTVAKRRVVMQAMERISIPGLQALAILAMDWTDAGDGPKSWGSILSLLIGAITHGGLGDEEAAVKKIEDARRGPKKLYSSTSEAPLFPATDDWKDIEERRRVFWLTFILDRYASVSTGWAFGIQSSNVRRRLPGRSDSWMSGADQHFSPLVTENLPSPLGSPSLPLFAYFASATHILGEVHSFVRQPLDLGSIEDTSLWHRTFHALAKKLSDWFGNLPDKVRRLGSLEWIPGDSDAGLKVMIYCLHYATVIRLQSSIAYPPVSSTLFAVSEPAGIECTKAALALSRVARLIGPHVTTGATGPIDPRDMCPILSWSLWVGGRALVAHSYIKSTPLQPEAAILVETLETLGLYWSTAKRYCRILTAALAEANPPTNPYAPVPTLNTNLDPTVGVSSILSDMRKTAWGADAALREGQPSDEDEDDGDDEDGRRGGGLDNNGNSLFATAATPMSHVRGEPGWTKTPESGWIPGGGGAFPQGNDFGGPGQPWAGEDLFAFFEIPQISVPPSPS